MTNKNINFIFWGTSEVSVFILESLKKACRTPSLVVTLPDRPQGRKMLLTPPPVKAWADKNGVKSLQPEKFDENLISKFGPEPQDIFLVVAYGKIIPIEILNIPKLGSINLHYSLLPKFRGASPVESAILADERETGISLILMDEKTDHGPIIAQEKLLPNEWPIGRNELMNKLNELGAK